MSAIKLYDGMCVYMGGRNGYGPRRIVRWRDGQFVAVDADGVVQASAKNILDFLESGFYVACPRDDAAPVSPCAECGSGRPGSVVNVDKDLTCAACGRDVSSSTSKPGDWLNGLSSAERKECAVARGVFAYFPDAIALVARHSVRMNEKHNPGQSVHWSRDKSTDHEDCKARHLIATAINPDVRDADGAYEKVCKAWRALADLQIWIEQKHTKGEKI